MEAHTLGVAETVYKNPLNLRQQLPSLQTYGEHTAYDLSFTPAELRALRTAVVNGYYCWPRKATLDELAKKIGLSRRGFQDALRRAEAKFPQLLMKYLCEKRAPSS